MSAGTDYSTVNMGAWPNVLYGLVKDWWKSTMKNKNSCHVCKNQTCNVSKYLKRI